MMQTERTLDLLAKCLELADSNIDGEALAAARKAAALRTRLGLSWRELLGEPVRERVPDPAQQERNRILTREVDQLRLRVAELNEELESIRSRSTSSQEENMALRRALEEARQTMFRREEELRQRLKETETLLASERNLMRQATEHLATVEEQMVVANRRSDETEAEMQGLVDRCRAIEAMLADMTEREIALRAELEVARRQAPTGNNRETLKRGGAQAESIQDAHPSESQGEYEQNAPVLRQAPSRSWLKEPTALPFVTGEKPCVIVEVKPLARMITYPSLRRAMTAMDNARRAGADYVVASASGVTLANLFAMDVDQKKAQAVLEVIDSEGCIDLDRYQTLRDIYNLKTIDVAALALQNDLLFSRLPWKLERLPDGESYAPLRSAVEAMETAARA